MRKILLAGSMVLLSSAMFGTTFTGLSPQGSYLFSNTTGTPPDVAVTPLFINLTVNGYTPGTELIIQGIGVMCFGTNNPGGATCTSANELPVALGGVFTN